MTLSIGARRSGKDSGRSNQLPRRGRRRRPRFELETLESRALLTTLTTYTWIGAAGGRWSDPGNWTSDTGIPGSFAGEYLDDVAVIPADQTIDLDVNPSLVGLDCGPGVSLNSGSTGQSYAVSVSSDTTLNSITLNSTTLEVNGKVEINQPSSIDGGGISAQGGIALEDTVTLQGGASGLDTPSLDGNGQVVFGSDQYTDGENNTIYNTYTTAPITLGPGITIRGQSGEIRAGDVVNQGQISSSGTITLVLTGRFDNQGTLQATSGGTLDLRADNGATDEGTIEAAGGVLMLEPTVTTDEVSPFTMTGGGQIQLIGELDNTGKTLSLDTSNGSFAVNGTIRGGTITAATPGSKITAGSVVESNATFDNVVLDIDLDVTHDGDQVTFLNGSTLNGTATLDNGGTLIFDGAQRSPVTARSSSGRMITLTSSVTP